MSRLPWERFTLSHGKPMANCKRCRADEAKRRRQADPESYRQKDRERYARSGSRYRPEYYQREKERIDALSRAWIAANPDRRKEIARESARRRRAADPERARAAWTKDNARRSALRTPVPRKRKYVTDDERREAFNARRRGVPRSAQELARHSERQKQLRVENRDAYRAQARERFRQWRIANPEAARRKAQRDTSKRNARKASADVRTVTERDLRRMLDRQHGRCFHCDQPEPTTIDHLIPLSREGRHAIGNLVWSCKSCNSAKGPRLLVEYRHGRSRRRIAV